MSFSNGPVVVTNGLVLSLDAGDRNSYVSGSTTWFDLAGTNNGTLTNGPTFNTGSGGSIVFDGANDYINIPSNTNIPVANSQYSINVWFSATSFTDRGLVGWGGYSINNAVTALRFYNNGFRHYWWANDLDVINLSMATNTWYNVVAQYNGTTRQILLNTQVVGQDTPTGHNVPYATNLTVGVTNSNEFMDGKIAVAQIYNRALSASEIQQNYNALKGRFGL